MNRKMEDYPATFGEFLAAKRRKAELTQTKMCDAVGMSPSSYCDIERNRSSPPDRNTLSAMATALRLFGDDVATFYDLADKAEPRLPEYPGGNGIVRVALRLANRSAADWYKFIFDLEHQQSTAVGG